LFHAIRASNDGFIRIVSDSIVEGWNQNGGFCGQKAERKVYFIGIFSKRANGYSTFRDSKVFNQIQIQSGATIGGMMHFAMNTGETLFLKIGISFVSIENARLNLDTEQPGWNFEQVKTSASDAWEKELSRIKIEGGSEDHKTIFYTALYHALIHPSICSDVNGQYRAMGNKRVKTIMGKQKNAFNVYSLWDTYRNLHPLLTLVYPEMQIDMVRTMVDQANENGFLPKWELSADETYVMVGDPGCIVIADTYIKGLTDFDAQAAYKAMLKSSTLLEGNPVRPGINQYIKLGYIPQDKPGEWVWGSVSTSLEYYIADFAIAQMSMALGEKEKYQEYLKRSFGYRNYFDPKTTFLRPKNLDGSWYSPFNPDTIKGSIPNANFPCGGVGYTEGNAWQYNFFVPHDINGLKQLMGEKKFVEKLRKCFDDPDRFVLFNEPDMAYPYLFTYAKGSEYLTQEMVRKCIDFYYANNSGGLPGNDDCGTTSSWLLFSAMGFYPACPSTTQYQIGCPLFEKISIKLNPDFYKGDKFQIEARNASNVYIQGMSLNGQEYKKYSLDHKDITSGGSWTVTLGEKPKMK
jgi:predicted alpha-1,2-mannosidase